MTDEQLYIVSTPGWLTFAGVAPVPFLRWLGLGVAIFCGIGIIVCIIGRRLK